MRPGGKSGADNRAEIVRILDTVEKNDETALRFGLIGVSDDVFESDRGANSGDGHDSLVIAGIGQAVELAAVFETNSNTARAGELNDFFNAGVLTALGDNNAVEGAPGLEGFTNRVNTGETIHTEDSSRWSVYRSE